MGYCSDVAILIPNKTNDKLQQDESFWKRINSLNPDIHTEDWGSVIYLLNVDMAFQEDWYYISDALHNLPSEFEWQYVVIGEDPEDNWSKCSKDYSYKHNIWIRRSFDYE